MLKKTTYIRIFLLTLSLQITICFAQKRTTFRLLVYGLPNFERQNSENVIAQKWGIEFYPVAGCVVSQELEDSVAHENKKVEPLIEKKYGRNWQNRFYKEVETEFKTEKKVSAIIDKLNYIKTKQAAMEKEGNGLHYIMSPITNSTKYDVSVQGWGTWKGEDEWVTYYKLLVDYEKKTAKLINDKVVKE